MNRNWEVDLYQKLSFELRLGVLKKEEGFICLERRVGSPVTMILLTHQQSQLCNDDKKKRWQVLIYVN